MLAILVSGGPVMIPIGLCAIIATVIIVERLMFYSSIKKGQGDALARIRSNVEKGRFDEAAAICETVDSPIARLMKTGIDCRAYPEAAVKEAVMNQANREVPRLEKYLSTLGTIASISTLLGLLGSVTGTMRAFGVIGTMGMMGNPAKLAGSISEVLVATAAGLVVAIFSVVFYNYFVARVNRMVIEMESSVGDFVLALTLGKSQHEV